ncbi:MAG: hypothetical protein ACHQ01_02070 [Candidatus Limnocylindrales bacterium]
MTFHDDSDLERRLRRIAESPEPPVPDSVVRYAREVARRERRSGVRFSLQFGRGLLSVASAVGIFVVAVIVAGLLLSARSNLAAPASPSPSGSAAATVGPIATPTGTPAPSFEPTPTPVPTPTLISTTGFTTPGVLGGWTGFSWASSQETRDNPVGRVIRWRGGYVATNHDSSPGNSLWISSDGQTWTPVTSIPGPWYYVASAPSGLVVISVDYGARSAPDQATPTPGPYAATVWTSTDGANWRNVGAPDFGGGLTLTSIAGTASGLVATTFSSSSDPTAVSGEIEFSTDGVHWTPETAAPALDWSRGVFVQSNAGRFFLMGGTTTPLAKAGDQPQIVLAATTQYSYVWWSDDGRTWARSGGTIYGYGQSIEFGRDGMLLTTDYEATPGGLGQAVSTDGGRTWQPDSNFGPLGQASCSGECSVGADGVIGGNGTYLIAVKNGGKKAWLSYDGQTWTPIAWAGGDPSAGSSNGFGGFTVLPRGVMLTGVYGAAK